MSGLGRVATGALAAVAVLLVSFGVAGAGRGTPAPAASAPVTTTEPGPTWSIETASADPAPVRPARVRIPAIGVDTALVDIGVDGTGALIPPTAADIAGWFTAGPAPGSVGPALLAGHVDSRAGPGVFFRLVDLRPGDRIEVERTDGSRVAFAVATTRHTPKTAFPTDLVYAPTPVPELRLVTCGGTFDRSIRSYRDNIIVEAVLTTG
ncbi:class F sortase [Actinokineospora sp. NBRC 105648]|uniref:class F sortase n=1 Tax=Actinokineospora sp. NBRC 105648 TaxID=3032206 RepID=UPI0024A0C329|nr:class F sortase [Actinokineospora sp. NBRC 105648]GLZ43002.1 class F sortase [Actinokineospora sp. NBRC 105648]